MKLGYLGTDILNTNTNTQWQIFQFEWKFPKMNDDYYRDEEIKYWRPHFRVNDSDDVEPKTVTMFLCRGDGKIDVVSAMGTLEGICVPV